MAHKPDGDDLYNELTLEGPRKCQSCKYVEKCFLLNIWCKVLGIPGYSCIRIFHLIVHLVHVAYRSAGLLQKYNTSLVVFSSSLSHIEFVLCSAIETEGLLFQFRSFRGYLRVLAPSEIEPGLPFGSL